MSKDIISDFTCESPNDVLVSEFGLSITKRDILTLEGQGLLNDQIINFYMKLLIKRGSFKDFPNVRTMSSFFYSKFRKERYSSIQKWTKNVHIFSMDLVVVRIHFGAHWCLSIIDFRDKSIRYYDSMRKFNKLLYESKSNI